LIHHEAHAFEALFLGDQENPADPGIRGCGVNPQLQFGLRYLRCSFCKTSRQCLVVWKS
jgi:hypothetical protein